MSRKIISGVLERIIFTLREKNIGYEIKNLGKENGFQEQITVKIKDKNIFIYIIKNEKKITYHIVQNGKEKRSISRPALLQKIKEL